jgi:hypothetical protein
MLDRCCTRSDTTERCCTTRITYQKQALSVRRRYLSPVGIVLIFADQAYVNHIESPFRSSTTAMKLYTPNYMLAPALALASASPTRGNACPAKQKTMTLRTLQAYLMERARTCSATPCSSNINCYGYRCGDCQKGRCKCPPEAVSFDLLRERSIYSMR